MTAAKRGDLVVIHVRSRSYALHSETSETDEYSAGVVTSVSRDGTVKRWRRCDDLALTDHLGRPYRGRELPRVGYEGCAIMPAGEIDVAGAMATAACHVWPGDHGYESAMYFRSLAEVREALRPHLLRSPGWDALRDAAVTREAALQAADEAYRQAGAAANRAQAQAGYGSREGREERNRADREASAARNAARKAANDAYRAVYADVTAEQVAA